METTKNCDINIQNHEEMVEGLIDSHLNTLTTKRHSM